MLNGLDLFSGIGGLTVALAPWVEPVAYCESDRYAQSVLLCRMVDGSIPVAPIWDDVRTLKGGDLPSIDILYGGFPCQDVSLAGNRIGLEGQRTGLFREAVRLVRECRPKFVFFENVPGIRRYVPSVRGELEALGYSCRDGFLSAAECGAPHIRNRWWLLANSERDGGGARPDDGSTGSQASERKNAKRICPVGQMADTARAVGHGLGAESNREQAGFTKSDWWAVEPSMGRVADGVPLRTHRIKGLGNAVVPLQARVAFEVLSGLRSEL